MTSRNNETIKELSGINCSSMNIRSDIKIVELKFKNAKRNAFLTNINFVCEYKSSVGKMSRKGLT